MKIVDKFIKKRRIPYTNMTGSYPGILSLSRAQEISWQYSLLRTVILQEKSRWVPLKVACEEGLCEKSRASGSGTRPFPIALVKS